eukprot:Cvel_28155.t1-p1 / transcript=Cvel_28155.t1 / gene=Cvel_28155 / organism=Chromera_velia_CCMP2878 / gene_product=Autophagy-related protein 18c, putative / transcript_product=Autophagy-related protein 18c, putative / location=Cvel_scaffold3637:210-2814(-) / protein_length=494 / sequence_SO=supercontig / SO=protein_coding / is_pseudo=false
MTSQGEIVRSRLDPNGTYLLSFCLSKDGRFLTCATTEGFRLYDLHDLVEVVRRERADSVCGSWQRSMTAEVRIATVLLYGDVFYFPAVWATEEGKVKIWNESVRKFVAEIRQKHQVKGMDLTKDIIAVVTEYAVYIYTLDRLQIIRHIPTGSNPRGLCTFAPEPEDCAWKLACPAATPGSVHIRVGGGELPIPGGKEREEGAPCASFSFEAHKSPLVALAFNRGGSLLATAGETGTLVRVFSACDGTLLHELRRGTQGSAISCLTFRNDSKFLAVASSSSTVHVFRLQSPQQSEQTAGEKGRVGTESCCLTSSHASAEDDAQGHKERQTRGAEESGEVAEGSFNSEAQPSSSSFSCVEPNVPVERERERMSRQESSEKDERQPKEGDGVIQQQTSYWGGIGASSSSSSAAMANGTEKEKGNGGTPQAAGVYSLDFAARHLSSAVRSSVDLVSGALKQANILPQGFTALRSFAQFHMPSEGTVDIRHPSRAAATG